MGALTSFGSVGSIRQVGRVSKNGSAMGARLRHDRGRSGTAPADRSAPPPSNRPTFLAPVSSTKRCPEYTRDRAAPLADDVEQSRHCAQCACRTRKAKPMSRPEVIETKVGKVNAERARRDIGSDERVIVTNELGQELIPGQR